MSLNKNEIKKYHHFLWYSKPREVIKQTYVRKLLQITITFTIGTSFFFSYTTILLYAMLIYRLHHHLVVYAFAFHAKILYIFF